MESTEGSASESTDVAGRLDVEVTAHRSAPDRVVFTETDNVEGWISTDITVDLRR